MNRQGLVFVVVLAVAGVAAAYSLGFLGSSSEEPVVEESASSSATPASSPAAPTPAPAITTSTPRSTPRPDAPPVAPPAPVVPVAPTTATLRIDSDVPGAQVFIDNKFVGTAPATIDDVQPGQRKINVQAPGHESVAESFDITPGSRDIVISLKTIRLDQKIAAVHKHRIGSCSGTLIATPDGIRYETTNKDDGFNVPLTNLETFTADFLQKNLKLKIRNGKSYDFTDPAGKADALYLFHQEVEKVRKRLLDGGK